MFGQREYTDPEVMRVLDLAKRIGARVHMSERNLDTARSTPDTGEVWVSRPDARGINLDEWFWTTLHELGHVASRHIGSGFLMMFGGQNQVAEQEAQAWMWAIKNAGRPLDSVGKATIAATFISYFRDGVSHYGPNVRKLFSLVGPEPDVDLMKRIQPKYFHIANRLWKYEYPRATSPLAA
jgi:hypothetical protein